MLINLANFFLEIAKEIAVATISTVAISCIQKKKNHSAADQAGEDSSSDK